MTVHPPGNQSHQDFGSEPFIQGGLVVMPERVEDGADGDRRPARAGSLLQAGRQIRREPQSGVIVHPCHDVIPAERWMPSPDSDPAAADTYLAAGSEDVTRDP
jgi:hypothetical protein